MKYPPILPTKCHFCGTVIYRRKTKSGQNYCDTNCKAEWQRTQKPVTKEWLHKHYVIKGLDCVKISRLVNRDAKSVWNWLKDFNIQTRPRGGVTAPRSFKKGCAGTFLGKKHTEETKEKIRQIALADRRVPYDPKIGSYMKGKRGAQTPNWKGGITADRQAVYSSLEWIKVSKLVWRRDKATCQKCGRKQNEDRSISFDIHHIKSFEVKKLRCKAINLVLLCEPCHYWVHSKQNTNKLWIK